jgi:ASC-1-like (ASCH) protein
MEYIQDLSEPWFSLVKLGIKTVEGRLNKKNFSRMEVGDIICFTNNEFGFERRCKVVIKKITPTEALYRTFYDYLISETLEKCLPGIDNIDDGKKVYYQYFDNKDEVMYGVKAFEMKVISI